MQEFRKFLQNKNNNSLVVAFLLAFATVNFVQGVVDFWNAGPNDYWVGQITRQIISFAILLLVAWSVARMAE